MSKVLDTPRAAVAPPSPDADAERLAALGYESRFERKMGLWENFSLGFTYLSPVVGVYSVFAICFAAGGPPMIWSLLIAGIGQLLVSLVFAEVVAQFPIAGGLYPWTRRLMGRRWAWITGWMYAWALVATVASVSTGAAPFIGALFGFTPTRLTTVLIAGALIGFATLVNFSGTKVLGRIAIFAFAAELVGAIAVGGWLLLTERHQPLSVFFHNFGTAGDHGYVGPFLAASLLGLYLFYGFEACGDVAEEVPDPGKRIPVAMRRTIYIGGFAAALVTAALILAQPDFAGIINGQIADPIGATFTAVFGTVGAKIITIIVLISFVSCVISLQAAGSRLMYSYARDKMVFGSNLLSRFSEKRHVPPYAMLAAGILPLMIVVIAQTISASALLRVISFAAVGIYVAFQSVVLAALVARARGWKPSGDYKLGRWGLPVNLAALGYGLAAAINLAWPRGGEGVAWYDQWVVLLGLGVVLGSGLVYMLLGRPYRRGTSPAGDAVSVVAAPEPVRALEPAPSLAG